MKQASRHDPFKGWTQVQAAPQAAAIGTFRDPRAELRGAFDAMLHLHDDHLDARRLIDRMVAIFVGDDAQADPDPRDRISPFLLPRSAAGET